MRILKSAIAAAVAVSMTATPALAQSAMPLSLVATAGMMQDDDGGGSNEGNQLLPALIIAGVVAAIILLVSNKDSDLDNPASP